MATGFRTIPSVIGQMAAAKQIEAAEQNILSNQIQMAAQQERLNQLRDPQNIALQQLQAQLQTAQVRQQLEDLANPQAAMLRKIQQQLSVSSVDPTSGIIASPVGLEGETIFTPRALTEAQQATLPIVGQLTPGQQEAFPDLITQQPTVAPGAPIQPITLGGRSTGFMQDIESAISGTQAMAQAKRIPEAQRIAEIKARYEAAGVPTREAVDEFGNIQVYPTRMFEGQAPTATQVKTATGENLKAAPKSSGKGVKGLTANQQANYRLRGGRALVDINQFTDSETGQVDWDSYVTKVGEAEGNALSAANVIKNARTAAAGSKTTLDEKNFQLYGNRMSQSNDIFDDLSKAGFDPTSLGTEGLLGGWSPNLLKTNERQKFEQAERNFINSTLRRESGAVITDDEFANARQQYMPQPGDGEGVLAQKSANRNLVVDEFRRLGGQEAKGPENVPPPSTATAPIAPKTSSNLPKVIRITPRSP